MSVQRVIQTPFALENIYGFTNYLISTREENRACLPQSGRHFCPTLSRLEMGWERSVNLIAYRMVVVCLPGVTTHCVCIFTAR